MPTDIAFVDSVFRQNSLTLHQYAAAFKLELQVRLIEIEDRLQPLPSDCRSNGQFKHCIPPLVALRGLLRGIGVTVKRTLQ